MLPQNIQLILRQFLTEDKIKELLVLDVRDQDYFTAKGFQDQHMGGMAFAREASIMGWLFRQENNTERNRTNETNKETAGISSDAGDCF